MSYELEFKKPALKEWKKLGATVQTQFKKKLLDVLANPHMPGSKLSGAMTKVRLYASLSTLFWKRQILIPYSRRSAAAIAIDALPTISV